MIHPRTRARLVLALIVFATLLVPTGALAAPGDNLVANPSLETDGNGDGVPDCWKREPFPSDAGAETTYALVPGHSGVAQRITANGLTAGENRKIAPEAACASPAEPGAVHDFSVWYRADAEDIAIELYHRAAGGGGWDYWTTYKPAITADWTLFEGVTPALPAGKDAIGFAVVLYGDDTADTDWIESDDYFLSSSADAPPVDEVNIRNLNQPTAIEFLPGEMVAISEKPGAIKIFESLASTTPVDVVRLEDRVSSFGDFGFTSLAYLDGFLFGTYQVDDRWGDVCPTPGDQADNREGCVTTGRLSKWPVAADGTLGGEIPVLEGYDNFCFQYITHGVDALEVDPRDGTLLMSIGDGANFAVEDNGQFDDPCGDGPPNGGAFRSQTNADYDGKVIRIDPATGDVIGVEATGLRNPFRMSLAGDDLYISDTGWGSVEELNLLPLSGPSLNFGWPCFEGSGVQLGYEAAFDNPICETIDAEPPAHEYLHPPETGYRASITAVEELDGKVYFGDVTLQFIKSWDPATPDAEPIDVVSGDGVNPVDLKRTPNGGLVYVDIGIVNVGASAIEPNSGSIEPVVAGRTGEVTQPRPSAEVLLQQNPYHPGDEVPFTVKVEGFRVRLDYDWTVTVTSCASDGTDCERRELPFAGEGTPNGSFVGPDDDSPAAVEVSVVVSAISGATVSDTATVARAEGGGTEPPGTEPPVSSVVTRIAGDDRIRTAVEISRRMYSPGVPVAYVARADDFPDALAAGPLAAATGGPILLTATSELAAPTAEELARLAPAKVIVLGGSEAVSDAVLAAIGARGLGVERLAGPSRFDTAAAIAAQLGAVDTVYVATGERFPDALVGGVAAGQTGGAVLLTGSTGVPAATSDLLAALMPERIVLLGGEQAVSAAAAAELGAFAPVTRIFGADRYDTAVALSQAIFETGTATAYVATGEAFPDALSVAPTAIGDQAALLLTQQGALPGAVEAELERLGASSAVVVGGEAAVSAAVVTRLEEVVGA